MAATRSVHRAGQGAQPADGFARRYDAPSARGVTRYDAPSAGAPRRIDVPPARMTSYRAPSSHNGTTYISPVPRAAFGVRA